MEPLAVLALLLVVVFVGLAVVLAADGPPSLPQMFRYQQPGWPRGVQEDDDARWAWRRRPDPSAPAVERLHGRVGAARRD